MKKKNFFWSFLMAAVLVAPVALTSCGDDNNDDDGNGGGTGGGGTEFVDNKLSGSITSARTLDASVEYLLNGPLLVEKGGTLTIPAGTTIKAQKGFGSYILVLQGGKIFVNGTADKPVTMTSNEATPKSGDWGGLVINGLAPLAGGTTGSTEISKSYIYGGDNAADNSGSISYLILKYTGAQHPTDPDIEHNGLTLNGVGSATKIENVYIAYGMDDAIEFFGGSVSVTNLLAVNPDDDMFDMTQGWNGKLENCYGIWEQGYSSNESDASGVEADGNLDGNTPDQTGQSDFTIKNMTIDLKLAPNTTDTKQQMNNVLKVRRGAKANITNALVKGTGSVKTAGAIIDMTDSKGTGDLTSTISITNQLTATVSTETKFGDATFPNVKVAAGNAGCDKGVFSWTSYGF